MAKTTMGCVGLNMGVAHGLLWGRRCYFKGRNFRGRNFREQKKREMFGINFRE